LSKRTYRKFTAQQKSELVLASLRGQKTSSPGSRSSRSAASGARSSRRSTKPAPVIGAYIDSYHHRPHSGLAYRTPREVAATWKIPTTS
jgi:hypothetical protein